MPTYKLIYFNARGYGEAARMLFALAGVDYEDFRFTREEWPKIRPTTPFNQAPVLEIDGVQIAQTTAIYRYLARQFGYAGDSPIDEARADMIVECVKDMVQGVMKARYETDETAKAALIKKLQEETVPPQLEKIAAFLGENQYFLGAKLSWADVVWLNMWKVFEFAGVEAPFDKYPNLKSLASRVEAVPQIAEWIKKRPVTEM